MKKALLFISIFLTGCEMKNTHDEKIPIEITINNFKLRVPKEEILSYSDDKKTVFYYISIIPRNEDFELIYSDKNYRDNGSGGKIPTVAHISDGTVRGVETKQVGHLKLVCENHTLNYNCGFAIDHDGMLWSVLIDRKTKLDPIDIYNKALVKIVEYRGK